MKADNLPVLFAGLAAVVVFTVAASTIEWSRDGFPIFNIRSAGPPMKTVEFGLRSDGVVVWREITHGKDTTNSPSELPDPPPSWDWHTNWYYWRTNIWLTNSNVEIPLRTP